MKKYQVIVLALSLALGTMGFVSLSEAADTMNGGHNHSANGGHEGMSQPQGQSMEKSPVYTTTGVIDAIDLTGKKLKISHKAVPALRWPDMTMMFSVEGSALLDHVKVGDKVSFDFYPQGSSFVISDLKVQ